MLDFETAREIVLKHAHRSAIEKVPISESLGRVLAEDIRSREPLPLFDTSSVDGYAVRVADLSLASSSAPAQLPLAGVISAGSAARQTLKMGETIRIMTGAPLPRYAEAVVMKESVRMRGDEAVFVSPVREGANLRRKGEEFAKGEIVVTKGNQLTPPAVGMCATVGRKAVKAYARPSVALVITGNEVRSPSASLRRGQTRDSNSYSIGAALEWLGISPVNTFRAKDRKQDLSRAFAKALKSADVVVSVGGVSVGDFDFVKEVLADLRVQTIFWRIAMKPGKPNFFGVRGRKLIFGLPGNPVSALVSFETLVYPALQKMMGMPRAQETLSPANIEIEFRRSPGRLEFVRAIATRQPDGHTTVKPLVGQGSHMLGGLAKANCLMVLSEEKEKIEKGDEVSIRFLSWIRR